MLEFIAGVITGSMGVVVCALLWCVITTKVPTCDEDYYDDGTAVPGV